ncbi:Z-ring formation inhibitor MciZ [Paenibacillus sp. GD4]|uniref:Z-ring formation inhibitor MciZ n=1 Tax=Paenibacillus sp. GD4 TaxID=3068890 RepID=UPI002796902B|nr:Z-ring formation inhibitor MciZ [Paenibacillus sp. GD4]MDQ1909500.1 Z-ring formation inhibitor MciZ [Paenibacillus sp. GD4]
MKSYTAVNQVRLVGKAWEIRRYLQMALQRLEGDMLLTDFLHEQIGYQQGNSRPPIGAQALPALRPLPVFDKGNVLEFPARGSRPALPVKQSAGRVLPFQRK